MPQFVFSDIVRRQSKKYKNQNEIQSRSQKLHEVSGMVVRTYNGVSNGTEDDDPDGLNPEEGEVQVCWSTGAVENIKETLLELVDRGVGPGELVVKREIPSSSDIICRTDETLWNLPPPVEKIEPMVDQLEGIFLNPFKKCFRGLILSARQVVDVRLTSPCTRHHPVLEKSPNRPDDKSHSDSSVPFLEQSFGVFNIRNISHPVVCGRNSKSPLTSVEPLPHMNGLCSACPVIGYGWIGVAESTTVNYTVKLDGGAVFKVSNDMNDTAADGPIIRPDPSYGVVCCETWDFFVSQPVLIASRFIDLFRRGIEQTASQLQTGQYTARQRIVDGWVTENTSAKKLGRGLITDVELIEAHVQWIAPLGMNQRKRPSKAVKTKGITPIKNGFLQLGRPVEIDPDSHVEISNGELLRIKDILQNSYDGKPFGIVDNRRTYVTILWDNGCIEKDVSTSELRSLEWISSNAPDWLDTVTKAKKCKAFPAQREEAIRFVLNEKILSPNSIVRYVQRRSCREDYRFPLLEPNFPECSNIESDLLSLAETPRAKAASPTNIPIGSSSYEATEDLQLSNSAGVNQHLSRDVEVENMLRDLNRMKSGLVVEFDPSETPAVSCEAPKLAIRTKAILEEERTTQNDHDAISEECRGFIAAIDSEKNEAAVAWIKDEEKFLKFLNEQRKMNRRICSSTASYPTIADIGLCICQSTEEMASCPAYSYNTSILPVDLDEWFQEIYPNAHAFRLERDDLFELRRHSLEVLAADLEWNTAPGYTVYARDEFLYEYSKAHKYFPEKGFVGCVLAFVNGVAWVKTLNNQLLQILKGETESIHFDRTMLHMDLVEEFSDDDDEDDDEDDEDDDDDNDNENGDGDSEGNLEDSDGYEDIDEEEGFNINHDILNIDGVRRRSREGRIPRQSRRDRLNAQPIVQIGGEEIEDVSSDESTDAEVEY